MRRVISYLLLSLLVQTLIPTLAQDNSRSEIGFVEAAIDNENPFTGQPILYRFRFYYSFTPNAETYDWPDFIGFGQEFRPQFLSVAAVEGVQYTVYQQDIGLYPSRTGTFEIEPTIVTLPETPFQRGAIMQTRPATVFVRPLPDGAPTSFNGAVGQYDMTVTLEPASIKLGDFGILKLSLTGVGNIQQMLAPDFALPPGWQKIAKPSQFQSNPNIPFGGTRIFEWQIFPNKDGVQVVAPIVFSYFNPQAEIYESKTGNPLVLEVIPNDDAFDLEVRMNRPTPLPHIPHPLKPLPATLVVAKADTAGLPIWMWLTSPLIASASGLWAVRQHRYRQNANQRRRSNAYKNALAILKLAQSDKSIHAYKQINIAIMTYFADKLQRPLDEITRGDILQTVGGDDLQARLKTCFELIDAGLYSPSASEDSRNLIRYVLETVKQIDELWTAS